MKKYAAFAASVAISAASLVGCGGGDDDFCGTSEDLEGQQEMPSSQELQDIVDDAPDEIRDDVQTVFDALEDPASADQAEAEEAGENIDAWIDENCGN
jgi:hypothetical protein